VELKLGRSECEAFCVSAYPAGFVGLVVGPQTSAYTAMNLCPRQVVISARQFRSVQFPDVLLLPGAAGPLARCPVLF